MKVADLLVENAYDIKYSVEVAKAMMRPINRIIPSPHPFVVTFVNKMLKTDGLLSQTKIALYRVDDSSDKLEDGIWDFRTNTISIYNAYLGDWVNPDIERILTHEVAHVLDGERTKLLAYKRSNTPYDHKPTEVNSRFAELIHLLDRQFGTRRVSFDTYMKAAVTHLHTVDLNPTDIENVELRLRPEIARLPVADTMKHLRPMLGVSEKTYRRVVQRLHAQWLFNQPDDPDRPVNMRRPQLP